VLCTKGNSLTVDLPEQSSVQFKAVQAQNADEYDLTGTTIHADGLVQVIGATQCANIPADYVYCDFIDEALPPITSWGKEYYTAPFAGRKGGDTFLLIGSVAGQKIYQTGFVTGTHLFAVIDRRYGFYWNPSVDEASRWSSDQPFMVVQYLNSATWPDGTNSPGDPAMLVVNPDASYSDHVVFQSPASVGSQSPYSNFASVIVNNKATSNTTFDGRPITGFSKQEIDDRYSAYQIPSVAAGAHEVLSDSGVAVFAYGYGYDESYAWSAPGWKVYDQSTVSDSTSPDMTYTTADHCATLVTTESTSTLVRSTTVNPTNVTVNVDSGAIKHQTQSVASICALDTFVAASGSVRYYDAAGNTTLGTMTYTAPQGSIIVSPRTFAAIAVGETEADSVLTITNVSSVAVRIDSIRSYSSMLTSDSTTGLPFILAPNSSRNVNLHFTPEFADTLPLYFSVYPANAARVDSNVIGPAFARAGVFEATRPNSGLTIAASGSNLITANFTASRTGSAVVEAYSVLGDRVLRFDEFVNAGDASVSLNTERLAAGSYFLRVTMPDGKVATARFVKSE
jgi:hypothetical protein